MSVTSKRKFKSVAMALLMALSTLLVLLPLIAIFVFLFKNGISALNWDFFTKDFVPAGETGGGLRHAILGSVMLMVMASLLGVTVGIGGGVLLAEYPEHKLVPLVRLVSDVLSGVPAIVMGLVTYGLFVYTSKKYSAFAGGVALGFLMIPIVVRTTEEVLKLVPQTLREAGLALGLPKWKVIMSIVLPSGVSGIITGVMLAIARVAGEAAPLLMTAFGNNFFNLDPTKPIAALPLSIYNYVTSPYSEQHRIAFAAALVLVMMVFFTMLISRMVSKRR